MSRNIFDYIYERERGWGENREERLTVKQNGRGGGGKQ